MSKLTILSAARRRTFDNVPKLNKETRLAYFTLDVSTKKVLNTLRGDISKIGYLVSKAYFQTKGRFFEPSRFVYEDIKRAAKVLGIACPNDMSGYSPEMASRHKKQILNQFTWEPLKEVAKTNLAFYADSLVAIRRHKEDILFDLVSHCWMQRIEIPSYNQLVDIITDSFRQYDEQMLAKVNRAVNKRQRKQLGDFFDNYGSLYGIRELKRIDQGFTQSSMTRNAEILEFYGEHFISLQTLYKSVNLTNEAITHFSDAIYLRNSDDIKRLKNDAKLSLYFSSFIYDQFHKRHDFAADALIKVVKKHVNSARGNERKRRDEKRVKTIEAHKTVLNSAKDANKVMKLALALTNDISLSFEERNERVRQLITAFFTAENPDFETHIARVDTNIVTESKQADFYTALFLNGIKLQRTLGPMINAMTFDTNSHNQDLINAINYINTKPKTISDETPLGFLNKLELDYLDSEDEFNPMSKYRLFLYIAIAKGLKNKTLTLPYSYRYRKTQSYLISDEEWANHGKRLKQATSADKFDDGKAIVNKIGKAVTRRFKEVNARIETGENKYFTAYNDDSWRIKYPDPEYSIAKFIPNLLGTSTVVTLQDIMFEIERHTNFSALFTHRMSKGSRSAVDKRLLFAALMGLGTNLGHTGLSRATRSFSEKALRDVQRRWLSVENIQKANDRIVEVIQSLSLPTIFNDNKGVLHSSSDAKKVVVNVDSLLANYSYKYYGKEQGISVNSFLDEKQAFFHVNVLTSSDREAPHVLDGLVSSKHTLENDDVYQHFHSTDTHGYTEPIFAALHFLDVSFAPRIKNVHLQTLYAYEEKSTRRKSSSPLAPKTKINRKLILDNWDDILRLMVTMKLKRCSPAQMLKMLSSSECDNTLYKALKEFGRLLKTHFILHFVDDQELRQRIQKQLNRVELGQKLAEAVLFGRGGKLQVGLTDEIQLVMASNTLLRNMIILWNYLFLSDYCLTLQSEQEKQNIVESISSGSVIAWAHINFLGVYDFQPPSMSSFKSTFPQMKTALSELLS